MLSMDGKGRRGSPRKLGTRLLVVSACCAVEWQTAAAVRLLSRHAYPLHCLNVQNFCFANYWKIWRKWKDQQTKWNLTATSVLSLWTELSMLPCLEVGLLIRRYVSYWGNFSFAGGDHVLAAKHVQKTGLFGLELFGVAGGRSMACRRIGKKAIRYHRAIKQYVLQSYKGRILKQNNISCP